MLTALGTYKRISADLPRALETTARRPDVASDVRYFNAHIGHVKTIDDLLRDFRLYSFVTRAFGLGEMAYAKAMIRKVVVEGTDTARSFANRLTDGRYRELAKALESLRPGSERSLTGTQVKAITDRYILTRMEEAAGQESQPVRLALYFARKAPQIQDAYGLLADRALLAVAQGITGLPAAMSLLSIDRQASMIRDKLDMSDLKDPGKLDRLLTRFLARSDTAPRSSAPALIGAGSQPVLSADTLLSIQSAGRGGR